MIYFDHNATTFMNEGVIEAMRPYWQAANASSVHQAGRRARHAIDEAREVVAHFVGAEPAEIIWTGSGTEANNLAIEGFVKAHPEGGAVVIGATEHDSVRQPAMAIEERPNWTVHALTSDGEGINQPTFALAEKRNVLCSVMLANNESGAKQPIQALKAAGQSHWFWHADAVQALGKMRLHFRDLGVDLMSLSAHKIGGPKGVGALIMHSEVPLRPLILGGGHQKGLRSGTENVAGIVGFAEAVKEVCTTLEERTAYLKGLQKEFEECLRQEFPQVTIFSQGVDRLPNTSLVSVPGIEGEMLVMELDKRGVCVSSGSACHAETQAGSRVLSAMGIPKSVLDSTIRISFGVENTPAEVKEFFVVLKAVLGAYGV